MQKVLLEKNYNVSEENTVDHIKVNICLEGEKYYSLYNNIQKLIEEAIFISNKASAAHAGVIDFTKPYIKNMTCHILCIPLKTKPVFIKPNGFVKKDSLTDEEFKSKQILDLYYSKPAIIQDATEEEYIEHLKSANKGYVFESTKTPVARTDEGKFSFRGQEPITDTFDISGNDDEQGLLEMMKKWGINLGSFDEGEEEEEIKSPTEEIGKKTVENIVKVMKDNKKENTPKKPKAEPKPKKKPQPKKSTKKLATKGV